MQFNPSAPTIMHIDINSCFATIEQQANPHLRGTPIAVAAYTTGSGCILAASIEAKRFGVKTGMRVFEGKKLCPALRIYTPDADKYRFVHNCMHELLNKYCDSVYPKSIDEFVLNFSSHEILKKEKVTDIAKEIKKDIRDTIGDYISVSIGISTNRQLAKVAAGMVKPDGLVEITKDNFLEKYRELRLTDLHGINVRNEARLNSVGIYTVLQFYESPLWKIKNAFRSVNAFYWFLRLRGWESDDIEFERKSFGNSYSIPQNYKTPRELSPILAKLVNKTATRMRKKGYSAYGVHVGSTLKGGGYLHHGERLQIPIFYTSEIFENAFRILKTFEIPKPVHTLAVSCYDITNTSSYQLSLFSDVVKKKSLAAAQDKINNHFGAFVLSTANMLSAGDAVKDRIAFGKGGIDI